MYIYIYTYIYIYIYILQYIATYYKNNLYKSQYIYHNVYICKSQVFASK